MCNKQIRRIHISSDFATLDRTGPDFFLHIHKECGSKCRGLPSPKRVKIPRAALESVQTWIGTFRPNSRMMD